MKWYSQKYFRNKNQIIIDESHIYTQHTYTHSYKTYIDSHLNFTLTELDLYIRHWNIYHILRTNGWEPISIFAYLSIYDVCLGKWGEKLNSIFTLVSWFCIVWNWIHTYAYSFTLIHLCIYTYWHSFTHTHIHAYKCNV